MQSRVWRLAPWMAGLMTVLVAGSAHPQGSLDAGKTPAQMFSETCSTCHRRPHELRKGASAGFLRQHYMSGPKEAAAMASYLAGVPRAPKGKERPDRSKQQAAQEKAKAAQASSKSRRTAELSKAPEAQAQPQPDLQPQSQAVSAAPAVTELTPQAEAPPVVKLEPFEE